MPEPLANPPVFYDPAGQRRRRLRRTGWLLAIAITLLAGILIASILVNPWLPRLDLRPVAGLPHAGDTKWSPPPLAATRSEQKARRAQAALERALARTRAAPGKR